MSYSGTVRCSYCYEKGHNRLGCPARRKLAQAEPESYEGRRWHAEQAARKESIASRKCSYCSEGGHNRRGCKTLKEDRLLIKSRQEEYLNDFLETTSSAGFGLGSLVNVPTGYGSESWEKSLLCMVTDFRWENIDFTLKDSNPSAVWGLSNRNVVITRVVSTNGYENGSNGWRPDPKFNDVQNLTVSNLQRIIPGAFADFKFQEAEAAKLVSPTTSVPRLPEDSMIVNYNVASAFNLNPSPRDDDWKRRRVGLEDDLWKNVRRDEHTKVLHLINLNKSENNQ